MEQFDFPVITKFSEFCGEMGSIPDLQQEPVCTLLTLSAELMEVLEPFQCQDIIVRPRRDLSCDRLTFAGRRRRSARDCRHHEFSATSARPVLRRARLQAHLSLPHHPTIAFQWSQIDLVGKARGFDFHKEPGTLRTYFTLPKRNMSYLHKVVALQRSED